MVIKLAKWKQLFAPQILLRGRNYYDSALVEIEAMDERSNEASVAGTDTYSVEILFRKGQVVQMTYSCPYADGGEKCKHMAAVLFAAESVRYPVVSYYTENSYWSDKSTQNEKNPKKTVCPNSNPVTRTKRTGMMSACPFF